MSAATTIEWTNATWNPVRGCALVSPGCTNCYAMRVAHRFGGASGVGPFAGLTQASKGGPVWTGKVRLVPELLDWPLRRRKPLRIFVNSMSDLFHEDVPDEFIDDVFRTIAQCEHHTFQILTKRPERMRQWFASQPPQRVLTTATEQIVYSFPLPNVWLGVSVEDQARADERIPLLLQTPAAVRWISAEPLLGPVDCTRLRWTYGPDEHVIASTRPSRDRVVDGLGGYIDNGSRTRIDWVVAGGESGPGARPMHPDWVRSLRDQCAAASVPFFFKQWGSWWPEGTLAECKSDNLQRALLFPGLDYCFSRWAKRNTGRELDGRTHDEYPR